MEKHGNIAPEHTPDTEDKLSKGTKQASATDKIKALDNDVTKRLADATAESLAGK